MPPLIDANSRCHSYRNFSSPFFVAMYHSQLSSPFIVAIYRHQWSSTIVVDTYRHHLSSIFIVILYSRHFLSPFLLATSPRRFFLWFLVFISVAILRRHFLSPFLVVILRRHLSEPFLSLFLFCHFWSDILISMSCRKFSCLCLVGFSQHHFLSPFSSSFFVTVFVPVLFATSRHPFLITSCLSLLICSSVYVPASFLEFRFIPSYYFNLLVYSGICLDWSIFQAVQLPAFFHIFSSVLSSRHSLCVSRWLIICFPRNLFFKKEGYCTARLLVLVLFWTFFRHIFSGLASQNQRVRYSHTWHEPPTSIAVYISTPIHSALLWEHRTSILQRGTSKLLLTAPRKTAFLHCVCIFEHLTSLSTKYAEYVAKRLCRLLVGSWDNST